jgi:hypothetical protein
VREAVVDPAVADARRVHLPGEPLASVYADREVERQPGLQAHVHEAEDRVDHVVVQVLALAVGVEQFQLALAVAADVVAPAGLDGGQHADQPPTDAVPPGDLAGPAFLGARRTGQVNDRPAGPLGRRQRTGPHLLAELVGVVAEVLEESSAVAEEAEQADGVGQHPQRPAEPKPVPTGELTHDSGGVAL